MSWSLVVIFNQLGLFNINSMGFMHIGRGSGANSIISYCLWYYEHLSARTDLYFERF
jgi:hypothetical protein